MAGRSREELDEIRRANRRALGMADYVSAPSPVRAPSAPVVAGGLRGLAASVPGGFLSAMPTIRVGSAFPNVEYTWDPSQPSTPATASTASGGSVSALSTWLNRHVVRPFVEAGPVRYAPGDGYADYSDAARVVAGVGLAAGAAGGLWVLWRAFTGRRG